MAAPSRRERAAKSNLKPFAATLVACDGPPRWVAACVLFCFVLGSIAWIGWDIASLRGPALDASWAEFARVVCAWFVLNVALCLFLGVLDARAPGDDTRAAARFRAYPLFSWLTPGVQQLVFFWPAALYLFCAWLGQALSAGACAARPPFEGALMAHCGPSLCGMQLRELLLFRSDKMMTAHHVVTMTLAALAWRALVSGPDDCQWALATTAATAAMEAGSLGCVAWAVSGGGTTLWRAAYVAAMVGSHAMVLATGCVGHVARRPGRWEGWVVFGATLPLMYMRHAYMVAELRAGAASGVFVAGAGDEERREKGA